MSDTMPIPICPTVFRIVPDRDGKGNPGFKAVWHLGERAAAGILGRRDACGWRPTRDGVRLAMAYRYRDLLEYGKESEQG